VGVDRVGNGVATQEHPDVEKFPDGVKKIFGCKQMMDDALRFGITDMEYMLVAKTLKILSVFQF